MISTTAAKIENCRVGDIQTRDRSRRKQYYDGQRRRQSCTIYDCNRAARVKGLCVQHLKDLGEPQKLPIHSPMDDFLLIEHANSKFKKRKYIEEDDDSISNGKIL